MYREAWQRYRRTMFWRKYGTTVITSVENLFTKMRKEFGEFDEKLRKVNKLRLLEQKSRTYNKYVQVFKRAVRESSYEGRPLIEEFKRKLNGVIRRRLAEAELPPTTIDKWQERAVKCTVTRRAKAQLEQRVQEFPENGNRRKKTN